MTAPRLLTLSDIEDRLKDITPNSFLFELSKGSYCRLLETARAALKVVKVVEDVPLALFCDCGDGVDQFTPCDTCKFDEAMEPFRESIASDEKGGAE